MRINAPRKRLAQRRATQIPKLNRRSSLAHACSGIWLPVGWKKTVDLTAQYVPIYQQQYDYAYAYRYLGPSVSGINGNQWLDMVKNGRTAGPAHSILTVCQVLLNNTQGTATVVGRGWGTECFQINASHTGSSDYWEAKFANNASCSIQSTVDGDTKPVSGGIYVVVGTFDRNAATRGHLYVRRLDTGATETASSNTDITSDWDDSFASSGGEFGSKMAAAFIGVLWNRKLSAAEANSLLMDPFQLIAEERQTRLRALVGVPTEAINEITKTDTITATDVGVLLRLRDRLVADYAVLGDDVIATYQSGSGAINNVTRSDAIALIDNLIAEGISGTIIEQVLRRSFGVTDDEYPGSW